eukprot:CAMPEP_0181135250 /NCGR_PEP_ID=MMETSP1071-20121207/32521_1 /TAXON_ID=35127 /ORGANISM="Thalassiosira sp., Strain NH16" /LENGTH=376 /DNA_ID=CAMNT_0023221823 /DNA_START=52 /DNA_END=1179 /DNA_ORIENTATION=-
MTSWSIAIKTVGSSVHSNRKNVAAASSSSSPSDESAVVDGDDTTACAALSSSSPPASSPPSSDNASSSSESANFTIEVNPDDPLHSLHEKIEAVTGLSPERQRLIYRGRIINSGRSSSKSSRSRSQQQRGGPQSGPPANNFHARPHPTGDRASSSSSPPPQSVPSDGTAPRVRDVNGLCDMQTIHLVPRPDALALAAASANDDNNNNGGPPRRSLASLVGASPPERMPSSTAGGSGAMSLSADASMSLLAALLGIRGTSGVGGGGGNGGGADLTQHVERAVMMGLLEDDNGRGVLPNFASGTNDDANPSATAPGARRSPLLRGIAARESETFPRLAPLGNAVARRTFRRGRNNNNSNASGGASRAAARAGAARLTE